GGLELNEAHYEVLRVRNDTGSLSQGGLHLIRQALGRKLLIAIAEAKLRHELPHIIKRVQLAQSFIDCRWAWLAHVTIMSQRQHSAKQIAESLRTFSSF